MRKSWGKKVITISILALFVEAGVASANYGNQSIISKPLSLGITLYVGGSNPGNYTKIQDAIDNASNGDTIFVYNDSSPYIENIIINKSIALIGEDRDTTIIDGNHTENNVIYAQIYGIKIENFTIQNGRLGINSTFGIIIKNNTVRQTEYGIFLVHVPDSNKSEIKHNIITRNSYVGIHLIRTSNVTIWRNRIDNNTNAGIYAITSCKNITISFNNITNNTYGIHFLFWCQNNIIGNNNFIGNKNNHVWTQNSMSNKWMMNYWDNWIGLKVPLFNSMPKIIWSWYGPIPLFQFDFFPEPIPIINLCP